jgi:hypothetical protein
MAEDRSSNPGTRDVLAPGTCVQDQQVVRWLRAVPDGHLYRVAHVQTGVESTMHEYLPRSWALREGDSVVALTGRGPEFRAGLQRFLLRAQQAKQLEHPALPTVQDLWSCQGTAYALMPVVEGRSLGEVVAAHKGRLPPQMIWPWLRTCCDVAERLHAQGRIHGAWDPSAIWVMDNGELLLPTPEVDGGAQAPSPWVALEQTVLAPGRAQRGPWTDVFGIGALAGFMLTGQNPSMMARLLASHRMPASAEGGAPALPSDAEPQVQMVLAAIRLCLAPNPRERPKDIAQLRSMMALAPRAGAHRHRQVLAQKSAAVPASTRTPAGEAQLTAAPVPSAAPSAGLPRQELQDASVLPIDEAPTTPMPLAPERLAGPAAAPPSTVTGPPSSLPSDLQSGLPPDPEPQPTAQPVSSPEPERQDVAAAAAAGREVRADASSQPQAPALKLRRVRTKTQAEPRPPLASPEVPRVLEPPPAEVPIALSMPITPEPAPLVWPGEEPPAATGPGAYPIVAATLPLQLAPTMGPGPSTGSPPARRPQRREGWLAAGAVAFLAGLWILLDPPQDPVTDGPAGAAGERVAQYDRALESAPPGAGVVAPIVATSPAAAAAPALADAAAGPGAAGQPAPTSSAGIVAGTDAPAAAAPSTPASPSTAGTGVSVPAEPAGMASVPAGERVAAVETPARPAAPRLPRCTQALLEQSLGTTGGASRVSRDCR